MSKPRRWKRSESLEARRRFHSELQDPAAPGFDFWVRGKVAGDLAAVEALGVAWLPEQPELPGEMTLTAVEGEAFILDKSWHPLLRVSNDSDAPGALRFAQAVVATWNAWGSGGVLRKKLEAMTLDENCEAQFTLGQAEVAALLAKPWEEKP